MRHHVVASLTGIGMLALLLAGSPPAGSASARSASATAARGAAKSIAPADTYFGPFGMSPLSIRSTIGLLGREYHARTIDDRDLLRKALITENALRIWRATYPGDPWLAPTFFHLEQLYQAVQSEEARKHATAILRDIDRYFPVTPQGHLSRARLAAGFPPLVPETPLIAASPAPTASPDVVDAGGSTPAPSPAPRRRQGG